MWITLQIQQKDQPMIRNTVRLPKCGLHQSFCRLTQGAKNITFGHPQKYTVVNISCDHSDITQQLYGINQFTPDYFKEHLSPVLHTRLLRSSNIQQSAPRF